MRGMEEWQISVEVILAGMLWVLGGILVAIDSWGGVHVGEMGLLVAGVGAVLTIRRSHLHVVELQRRAFEFGRDYERGHLTDVTSIHR